MGDPASSIIQVFSPCHIIQHHIELNLRENDIPWSLSCDKETPYTYRTHKHKQPKDTWMTINIFEIDETMNHHVVRIMSNTGAPDEDLKGLFTLLNRYFNPAQYPEKYGADRLPMPPDLRSLPLALNPMIRDYFDID